MTAPTTAQSTVLLAELTRDEIERLAPNSTVVLPTAAIEQHGPHLPILTDTLLCGSVARRAAEASGAQLFVAPVMSYGNSHHHRPFAGVLSLESQHFAAAVTDVLEGLVLSGFRRLVVLNGHGGNSSLNGVTGLDFVNRLGHDVSIATADYWSLGKPALVERGLIAGHLIPGHAGEFETALVRALRPDLVREDELSQLEDLSGTDQGLFADFAGATVQRHGAWAASTGYTDNPAAATVEQGEAMLDVIVERVAAFLTAFHTT